MTTAIAIILARKGSKSIPGKNLQLVGDKSLLQRTVEAALGAKRVSQVFVNSDDAECRTYGALYHERPHELGGDDISSEAVLIEQLSYFETRSMAVKDTDITILLQCTTPFTTSDDIDGTIEAMEQEGADSALTVAPFQHFLWRDGNFQGAYRGGMVGVNHMALTPRKLRQERRPEFIETGGVYAFRTKGFLECGRRFFGKIAMYEVSAERAMEIDDPIDLQIANQLWPMIEAQQKVAV